MPATSGSRADLFPQSQHIYGDVDFTGIRRRRLHRDDDRHASTRRAWTSISSAATTSACSALEGELGYKHAKAKSFNPGETFVTAINTGAGTTFTIDTDFGIGSSASVYSAMVNGLLDFGGNGGIGGYAGGGVGYANVKQFGDSNGKLAWQLIAGVYAPVSPNIDIGLKYRYFHAGSNDAQRRFAFTGTGTCGTVGATFPCESVPRPSATTASSPRTACSRAWSTTSAQRHLRRPRRLRRRRLRRPRLRRRRPARTAR